MIVDALVIAVLLISALISFLRGFIRETLTILGVAGGLAAAYFCGPMLSPLIKGWLGVKEGEPDQRLFDLIPYSILGDILSYGAIFIVVVIVLSILSHVLAESARAIGLGAVDRTLGVVFGIARGILLLGIFYLPVYIGVEKETKAEWFEGSKTYEYLEITSGALAELIPESAMEDLKDSAKNATESGVKERLQQIDLLKPNANGDPSGVTPGQEPQAPTNTAPGYSDDFRKKMDSMFQQDAPATPPAAPAQQAPQPQQQQGAPQ